LLTLADAAELVRDGHILALGGMTLYRRPVAFVRALLRRAQRPRELTLLAFTAGFESDLLVGAGCVRAVRTVYFGLEAFGFAPMFTEAANQGSIAVIEETEASLAMGMRAQAAGVGFMPSRAWLGTDLPRLRPDIRTVDDPYTGERYTAFPAVRCDVAVIHALAADRAGNVLINNNRGVDLELAYIAETVIATAERIVERLERTTEGMIIPYPGVDYVVEAPGGARPTSCYPMYPLQGGALMDYVDACAGGTFLAYLHELLSHDP
jgi:glutaconate CoA-transferase subunit A